MRGSTPLSHVRAKMNAIIAASPRLKPNIALDIPSTAPKLAPAAAG